MQYTIIINGISYDIPAYTKSIRNQMKKIDADNLSSNLADDNKYKNMYVFIKYLVGEENAKEIFGTDNLDEMDLNEISVCYMNIVNAYDKPLMEATKQNNSSKISDSDRELVIEMLKNAGNIDKIVKAATNKNTASVLK